MIQKDIYEIKESPPFTIKPFQELRVDLRLVLIPKPAGCVEGWVRPLVKACIKAFDLCLNPITHTYTGAYGKYILTLPMGFYYLAAAAPGYNLSSLVRVRIVPMVCQTVNFWLTPLNQSGNPFNR